MRIAIINKAQEELHDLFFWIMSNRHDFVIPRNDTSLQQMCLTEKIDLFLIYFGTQHGLGLDLLSDLSNTTGGVTPIVVMMPAPVERQILDCLSYGAHDCLDANISTRVLIALLEAIIRRHAKPRNRATVNAPPYTIDHSTRTIWLKDKVITTTDKEFDLAALLFDNLGKSFQREHLLKRIWGYNAARKTRTVDTHISRIRRKLGLGVESDYRIVSVYRAGYMLTCRSYVYC